MTYDVTLTVRKHGNLYKIKYDKEDVDLIGENWHVSNNVVLVGRADVCYRLRDLISINTFNQNPISVHHRNKDPFDFRRKNLLSVFAGEKR